MNGKILFYVQQMSSIYAESSCVLQGTMTTGWWLMYLLVSQIAYSCFGIRFIFPDKAGLILYQNYRNMAFKMAGSHISTSDTELVLWSY